MNKGASEQEQNEAIAGDAERDETLSRIARTANSNLERIKAICDAPDDLIAAIHTDRNRHLLGSRALLAKRRPVEALGVPNRRRRILDLSSSSCQAHYCGP